MGAGCCGVLLLCVLVVMGVVCHAVPDPVGTNPLVHGLPPVYSWASFSSLARYGHPPTSVLPVVAEPPRDPGRYYLPPRADDAYVDEMVRVIKGLEHQEAWNQAVNAQVLSRLRWMDVVPPTQYGVPLFVGRPPFPYPRVHSVPPPPPASPLALLSTDVPEPYYTYEPVDGRAPPHTSPYYRFDPTHPGPHYRQPYRPYSLGHAYRPYATGPDPWTRYPHVYPHPYDTIAPLYHRYY